jgi:hypothetical protein
VTPREILVGDARVRDGDEHVDHSMYDSHHLGEPVKRNVHLATDEQLHFEMQLLREEFDSWAEWWISLVLIELTMRAFDVRQP